MESMPKSEIGRPASSALLIIAGTITIASGLVAVAMMAMWSSISGMPGYGIGGMISGWGMMSSSAFMWGMVGTVAGLTIGRGAILIIGGYSIQKAPQSAGSWGVAILIASIIGLIGMSGVFIGPIIGIIAGILALTNK
jgi:hypothetical protein